MQIQPRSPTGAPPSALRRPKQRDAESRSVVVFDLETVPDLAALARVHGLHPSDETGAEALLGGKFPKLIFHRIVCIGVLVAHEEQGLWRVELLKAPHSGMRSEAELIADFSAQVEAVRPQLVTFNGSGFDLPVLRYRALVNRVGAPGLTCRAYFQRYSEDALDLCDVLASFQPSARISLDALGLNLGMSIDPAVCNDGGTALDACRRGAGRRGLSAPGQDRGCFGVRRRPGGRRQRRAPPVAEPGGPPDGDLTGAFAYRGSRGGLLR